MWYYNLAKERKEIKIMTIDEMIKALEETAQRNKETVAANKETLKRLEEDDD